MRKYDFNRNWTVAPLDGREAPKQIHLPHDAMRTERRVPTSIGAGNIGWFEGLDYVYEKRFTPLTEWENKNLLLEFESVYHNAEVWLNGEQLAFRPYGYTNFYVELTGKLQPGENELRVIARNADQPNSRWYSGTGIIRPVWLWCGGENHIPVNGVKIRTLGIQPPEIEVRVRTHGKGTVELAILDGDAVMAATSGDFGEEAVFALRLDQAELWDVEYPKLYTARVRFGGDEVCESFGIRSLSWDREKGVAINGKRVVIRGACIHHDHGVLGGCTYPEVEERKIRILKEAGYNAVRSAHNPAAKYQLDACDKLGMLMMDEFADCWYMHKTEHDYASYACQWWQQDFTDMVDKDYNHPCVVMYSTGNEVAETAQEKGIRLQAEYTEFLHRLDPTRPVTCGINIFFNFLSSAGFGVYSDEKAKQQAEATKKAAAQTQTKKPKKKAVGSEFYNLLAARIGTDFMKFGASLPPCDWKTKGAFAVMDIAGYNYGNWRYKKDARKYPDRLILGSETLIGDAYDFWETAKTTPQLVGDFVWCGWEYIGEAGEGGPEFEDYKTDAPEDSVRGGQSRIDITGKLTTEMDYTRVAFELEPGPRLAVFPAYETQKPNYTGWNLTMNKRSWTWPGCEGNKTEILVFARAAKVSLYLNDNLVGTKKPKKGIAQFHAAYQPGTLKAVSYDAGGKVLGTDLLKTAGAETHLSLEPEVEVCRPEQMVYLRVRYTDDAGQIKPMEKHHVAFSVENGTIMGAINACAYFRGNFAQSETDTYFGEAQVVVRAGREGPVRVTASDERFRVTQTIDCRAEAEA